MSKNIKSSPWYKDPLKIIVAVMIIIVGYVLIRYYIMFGSGLKLSAEQDNWAKFGDFFGGFLGGISIIAIIYTLMIQQLQLKLQQKELKEQQKQQKLDSYERMVFWLIDSNQKILDEIYSTKIFYNEPSKEGPDKLKEVEKPLLDYIYDQLTKSSTPQLARTYFKNNQVNLINTYCRNLFNALKTINNNYPTEDITDGQRKNSKEIIKHSADTTKEIKKYTSLLRSFIPEKMVYVIAINISNTEDFSYDSYRELIKRYSILEHIDLLAILEKIIPERINKDHYQNYETLNRQKLTLEQELLASKSDFCKLNEEYNDKLHKLNILYDNIINTLQYHERTSSVLLTKEDIVKIQEFIDSLPNTCDTSEKKEEAIKVLKSYEAHSKLFLSTNDVFYEKKTDRTKKQDEIDKINCNNKSVQTFTDKLKSLIDIQLINELGEEYFATNQEYLKIKKELIEDFRIEFPEIKFTGIEPTQEN